MRRFQRESLLLQERDSWRHLHRSGRGHWWFLGTRNNLICAKSVDDEIVYNVVKSIIEHHDDLADVHPKANQFNKENASRRRADRHSSRRCEILQGNRHHELICNVRGKRK